MKQWVVGFFTFFSFAFKGNAQSKVVADLTNVRNDKGVCRVCIFNNAQSFKGETGDPVACVAASVKNQKAQAIFNNLSAGNYAVFVFHDENGNNKMDTKFFGIPKEGYGASNNKLPLPVRQHLQTICLNCKTRQLKQLGLKCGICNCI